MLQSHITECTRHDKQIHVLCSSIICTSVQSSQNNVDRESFKHAHIYQMNSNHVDPSHITSTSYTFLLNLTFSDIHSLVFFLTLVQVHVKCNTFYS